MLLGKKGKKNSWRLGEWMECCSSILTFDIWHKFDGRVFSSTRRPHFTPKVIPWYSFLLQAGWTPRLLTADRRMTTTTWRYSPSWSLASCAIRLHKCPSWAFPLHPSTPIARTSSWTPSNHPPLLLLLYIFSLITLLAISTVGLSHLKLFNDPTGNQIRDLPLVAQCLNQMRHHSPHLTRTSDNATGTTLAFITGTSSMGIQDYGFLRCGTLQTQSTDVSEDPAFSFRIQ